MSRNAATTMIIALSLVHSVINRFLQWSSKGKGNHLNRWHKMVHVPLSFLPEWHEFPSMPCHGGEKN